MTRSEALAEARRRWGAEAMAHFVGRSRTEGSRFGVFAKRGPDSVRGPHGFGPSYEAAFADADRRSPRAGE